MRSLNINEKIKVKLTEQGKDVVVEQGKDYLLRNEDENGFVSIQLWTLMQVFGPAFICSTNCKFFENNNIMIDEKKLK